MKSLVLLLAGFLCCMLTTVPVHAKSDLPTDGMFLSAHDFNVNTGANFYQFMDQNLVYQIGGTVYPAEVKVDCYYMIEEQEAMEIVTLKTYHGVAKYRITYENVQQDPWLNRGYVSPKAPIVEKLQDTHPKSGLPYDIVTSDLLTNTVLSKKERKDLNKEFDNAGSDPNEIVIQEWPDSGATDFGLDLDKRLSVTEPLDVGDYLELAQKAGVMTEEEAEQFREMRQLAGELLDGYAKEDMPSHRGLPGPEDMYMAINEWDQWMREQVSTEDLQKLDVILASKEGNGEEQFFNALLITAAFEGHNESFSTSAKDLQEMHEAWNPGTGKTSSANNQFLTGGLYMTYANVSRVAMPEFYEEIFNEPQLKALMAWLEDMEDTYSDDEIDEHYNWALYTAFMLLAEGGEGAIPGNAEGWGWNYWSNWVASNTSEATSGALWATLKDMNTEKDEVMPFNGREMLAESMNFLCGLVTTTDTSLQLPFVTIVDASFPPPLYGTTEMPGFEKFVSLTISDGPVKIPLMDSVGRDDGGDDNSGSEEE